MNRATSSRTRTRKSAPTEPETKTENKTENKPATPTSEVLEAEVVSDIESVTRSIVKSADAEIQRLGQVTPLTVRGLSNDSDELELDGVPFRFDYTGLNHHQTTVLKGAAVVVRQSWRTQHKAVLAIGKALIRAKEVVPDGKFMAWFHTELGWIFSYDTAENYMTVAKLSDRRTLEEMERVPLNVLYEFRSNTPPDAEEHILTAAAEGKSIKRTEAKRIIRQYKELQVNNFDFSPEVKRSLVKLDLATDTAQLEQLARLSQPKRERVLELIQGAALHERPLSVREAVNLDREVTQREQSEDDAAPPLQLVPVHHRQPQVQRGDWLSLLAEMPSESVDFCFAQVPLRREALQDYQPLAQHLSRILRPEGMLLSVVSQQNIQFVGDHLDPLRVAWTFMMLRRPGNSPRIVGRITFASSYVPLSLAYKDKLKSIVGTYIDDSKAAGFDHEAYDKDDKVELFGLEDCIAYYLRLLTQSGDDVLHLITNAKYQFEGEFKTALNQTCEAIGINQLYCIEGNGT